MEPILSRFLVDALREPSRLWQPEHISDISRLNVPEELFSARRELLRCDIHCLWAVWYLESIYDPERYDSEPAQQNYATVYRMVLSHVDRVMAGTPRDERVNAARVLAKLLQEHLQRRVRRKRRQISREHKLKLLDAVIPEVRCWICGFQFSDEAVERFQSGEGLGSFQREFVDFFKPSGLRKSDHAIEVDHISPHSAGGLEGDNLALSCGWCNRHKGAFSSLYDQALSPHTLSHPKIGRVSTPRPFWVVRLLATRRRCEFEGGCVSCSADSQLTVSLRNPYGAANPTNLIVVCDRHDQMKNSRYVSRRHFGAGSR